MKARLYFLVGYVEVDDAGDSQVTDEVRYLF